MARDIKVHKTLGKMPVVEKIGRNINVANQLLQHPEVLNPPHPPAEYLLLTDEVMDYYTLHLKGNHEATLLMHEADKKMARYYYDTAEFAELLANNTNDEGLPIMLGFKLCAKRKTRTTKIFSVRDGNHSGEIIISYPRIQRALAYRIEIALVVDDADPDFRHAAACGITSMTIRGLKSYTKYLIRLVPIFARYEDTKGTPITFKTKEW